MGKVIYDKALVYTAGGTIAGGRIVKFGSDDKTVVQASAATDKGIGISRIVGSDSYSTGNRVDVVRIGVAEVTYGGNVTRGDLLTSDADGKAIVVTDALRAAADVRVVGVAEESGVAGDIGSVLVLPALIAKTYVPAG